MTRGEIWWVDFGIPLGSEVGFKRPVIILQNDILNESKLKNSLAHSGKNSVWYGKHHSEETKRKMSESRKLYWEKKNLRETGT